MGGKRFNPDPIGSPQKLFELVRVAQKSQIWSFSTLPSDDLESLVVTREKMIFTATVAKSYKT